MWDLVKKKYIFEILCVYKPIKDFLYANLTCTTWTKQLEAFELYTIDHYDHFMHKKCFSFVLKYEEKSIFTIASPNPLSFIDDIITAY